MLNFAFIHGTVVFFNLLLTNPRLWDEENRLTAGGAVSQASVAQVVAAGFRMQSQVAYPQGHLHDSARWGHRPWAVLGGTRLRSKSVVQPLLDASGCQRGAGAESRILVPNLTLGQSGSGGEGTWGGSW